MAEIIFTTDLGAVVQVPIAGGNASDLRHASLQAQRTYGALGWTSGEVPAGGYQFPLALHDDFDWTLIGARAFRMQVRNSDGSTEEIDAVEHRGFVYKRRNHPENKAKNLREAIRYTRGATQDDSEEHVQETNDAIGRGYVVLCRFSGGAPVPDGYRRSGSPAAGTTTSSETKRLAGPDADTPATHRSRAGRSVPPSARSGGDRTRSALRSLADSPENREKVLAFITTHGPDLDESATFTWSDAERPLRGFTRANWARVKEDFKLMRTVAAAIETAQNVAFA